jgi:hypothetical protein
VPKEGSEAGGRGLVFFLFFFSPVDYILREEEGRRLSTTYYASVPLCASLRSFLFLFLSAYLSLISFPSSSNLICLDFILD